MIISCWEQPSPTTESGQLSQSVPSPALLAAGQTPTLPTLALTPTLVAALPVTAANPMTASMVNGAPGTISPTAMISAAAQGAQSILTQSLGLTACPIALHLDLAGVPEQETLPTVLGCPAAQGSLAPVAINEFGKGPDYDRFMLWFSTDRQIYILFADHTWLKYTDTWSEDQPEITCNPTNGPRTTPPLPHRGFGKLWCTVDTIREKMGEIEKKERLCQHSVTQRFAAGYLLACFEDATIRYFHILDNGKWDMRLVQ